VVVTVDPDRAPERDFVDSNVRRVVGVATLRRIRKIVDERLEDERQKRRLVLWIVIVLGVVAGAAYLYFLA
jgi:hypothetical protein